MNELKIWEILGIEQTKDEQKIKAAYRKVLTSVNPEDNPEGFKQLRQAYEQAVVYASSKEENEEENLDEVDLWVKKVENIYGNISKRRNENEWDELLKDDVCEQLDTEEEAREKLLVFLMNHCNLPHIIWNRLDTFFDISHDKEKLYEIFPKGFIDFVINQSRYEDFIEYEFFYGNEDGEVDELINLIFEVKDMYDALAAGDDKPDTSDIHSKLEQIDQMDIHHPYTQVIAMMVSFMDGDVQKATDIMEELRDGFSDESGKDYMENVYISYYVSKILKDTDNEEEAFNIRQKILEKMPKHRMALLDDVEYYYNKGEYDTAKERSIDFLDEFGNYPVAIEYMRKSNEKLIGGYLEKISQGNKKSRFDLGWIYFQNEEFEKCMELMESDVPEKGSEDELEYVNLTGRCLLGMERYEEAFVRLVRWREILNELEDDGSEKYQKRIKRKGYANYILGMCKYRIMDICRKKEGKINQHYIDEAKKYIKEAIEQEESYKEKIYYKDRLAFMYLKAQRYKDCIDVCTELVDEIPQYYAAYVMREEAFYELGYGQKVIEDYYNALNCYNKDSRAYEILAKGYLHNDCFEELSAVFKTARENGAWSDELDLVEIERDWLLGKDGDAKESNVSECIKRLKNMEERFIHNNEECGMDDKSDITYLLAKIFLNLDRRQEGFKYLQDTVHINKEKELSVYWKIANEYSDSEEYEQELAMLRKMKRLSDDIDIDFRIANCQWRMGEDEKAFKGFLHVFDVAPEHYSVNLFLCVMYTHRYDMYHSPKDKEKALDHATRQCEIEGSVYNYLRRGGMYLDYCELDKAKKDFEKALELDSECNDAYYYMANVAHRRGKLAEAYNYMTKMISNPEFKTEDYRLYRISKQTIFSFMISICKALGRFDEAVKYAEMGYDMIDDYKWYVRNMMDALDTASLSKRLVDRGRKFKRETTSDYEEAILCIDIAGGYSELNELRKAEREYKNAIKLAGANKALLMRIYHDMSEMYFETQEDYKKSLKYALMALEYSEDFEDGGTESKTLSVAIIYAKIGDRSKAIEYYERFKNLCNESYGGTKYYFEEESCARSRLFILGQFYLYMSDAANLRKCIDKIAQLCMCSFCCHCGCYEENILRGGLCELENDYKGALKFYEKVNKESDGSRWCALLVENAKKNINK